MATFALIDTRTAAPVVRRQDFDEAPQLAQAKGLKWIPDDPPSYDTARQTRAQTSPVPTDATEVPYVVSDKSLDDVKAERKAELAAKRYEVEIAGVTVGGSTVATDRDSQAMLTGAKKSLEDGLISEPIDWKAESGFVQIDQATLAILAGAVAVHIQACFSNEAALASQIEACETADAVLAIDLNEGWPV